MKPADEKEAAQAKLEAQLEHLHERLFSDVFSEVEESRITREIERTERRLDEIKQERDHEERRKADLSQWREDGSQHPAFKEVFKGPAWTGYANFPLPLLAALPFAPYRGLGRSTRIEALAKSKRRLCVFLRDFALVYTARKLCRQTHVETMELPTSAFLPKGYRKMSRIHHAIGAAMVLHDRKGGDMDRLRQRWNRATGFLHRHDLDLEREARVQISLALLSDEHPYLNERDLRVLMAVNSCCGEQGWHQVSQSVLALRAVGATSEKQRVHFGVVPLTRRQVQLALEKLKTRGLIYAVTWNRRKLFVGNASRLEPDVFQFIVGKQIQKRIAKRSSQKIQNARPRITKAVSNGSGKVVFLDQNNQVFGEAQPKGGIRRSKEGTVVHERRSTDGRIRVTIKYPNGVAAGD